MKLCRLVVRLRDLTYRCVGEAAERALHLGQVRAGHDGGRLMVNANFESCRTPEKTSRAVVEKCPPKFGEGSSVRARLP